MTKEDKNLWTILKEHYGFKQHVYEIPINSYQEFREFWAPKFWLKLFPLKTKKKSSEDWLSANINGNEFEVLMVDCWYVELRKNGETIFSERRFNDADFLKLIV